MNRDNDIEFGAANEKPQKGSLADWAYARVRDRIRAGQLRPGDRITETEIVDWLKISRTPVREALQRLASDDLIAHDGRRGLVVSDIDHQMLLELYAIRESLEGTAARLAARYASNEEVSMLQHIIDSADTSSPNAKYQDQHNLHFHQALYRCARNRYLLRILSSMHDIMMLTTTPIAPEKYYRRAHTEHRAIVNAIAERNPDDAEEAARFHIRSALEARLAMLTGSSALEKSG